MADDLAAERPHIIVTEKDESVREAITDLLTSEGYNVIPVSDIGATRAELQKNPFSVLILDARLGEDAHGLDWLLDFVHNEGAPRTIILSGASSALALGERFGVTVVEKPFDIDALVAAIVSVTVTNVRAHDRRSSS